MPDLYSQLMNSPVGSLIGSRIGLPTPPTLRRYEPGQPVLAGPVILATSEGGRLADTLQGVISGFDGGELLVDPDPESAPSPYAVVVDATGLRESERLDRLYEALHPYVWKVAPSGRVVIVGTPPEECAEAREATAQCALQGFVRSLGKELGKGATAQLVTVSEGAEGNVPSTLRFLLSAKSAYVDAQVIRIGPGRSVVPVDWERPLADKVALVTGAAQGIGTSIAEILARDGAHVVCLDIPAQGDQLSQVANAIGGTRLQADITDADAPSGIVEHLRARHGGVDVVVHNAGVTRDKTLGKMREDQWDLVLGINLTAIERIDEALLAADDVLRPAARIVCVSSLNGIAGARGQTNYATSKAGVIGHVEALAGTVAGRDATINAVAPGFIETAMTKEMPVGVREVGRRLNSMSQGGTTVDVAETIAWLASPASGGVNGNVVRVCGQSLLGA